MTHPNRDQPLATLLVVSRFRVAARERPGFVEQAEAALAALTAQAGCLAASLGQATDDPELLLVRTEWVGVGAYRRALSAFEVKVNAIPLLSAAIDEPSAFEVVRTWDGTAIATAPSGLAEDAGQVGLGDAAGPSIRSVQP
jgi:quinol monooxygenase YgiN